VICRHSLLCDSKSIDCSGLDPHVSLVIHVTGDEASIGWIEKLQPAANLEKMTSRTWRLTMTTLREPLMFSEATSGLSVSSSDTSSGMRTSASKAA
jgi:hypothetical protein